MSLLAFRKARDETANLSTSLTDVSGARCRMHVFQPRQRSEGSRRIDGEQCVESNVLLVRHDFRRGLFHRILRHGGFRLNARHGLALPAARLRTGLSPASANRIVGATLFSIRLGNTRPTGALSGGFVSGPGPQDHGPVSVHDADVGR